MDIAAPATSRRQLRSLPLVRRVLLVLLGVLAAVCALLGQHPADPSLPGAPLVGDLQTWMAQQWGTGDTTSPPSWVVIASLAAIAGAAICFPGVAGAAADLQECCGEAIRRMAIGTGVLAIPCLLAAAIWSRERFVDYHVFTNAASSWGALLWLGGMAAGLYYLWPRRTTWLHWPAEWPRWVWLLLEGGAILAVLDIAAGLRFWHLGTLPEGAWFDEVDFAHSAQRLFQMPFQPIAPGNIGHNPSLYFYVMAGVLRLGGTSLATIRLSSALFGLLEVGAVYLIGRRMGGAALGLCAAALLAVAQWAIDFSRFGMSNIAAPAMIALGFLALCVAMSRPRAFWFALSGVLLGLSLLTYAGGFLAGGGVAAVVVALRLAFDAPFRRCAWPGALLLPVGLAVGAAPFIAALLLDPQYTLEREQTVSLFNQYGGVGTCLRELPQYVRGLLPGSGVGTATPCMSGLQSSTTKHLLMFTVAGDSNGRHNLPGAPMLDAVTGACLLLGLGICLRRLHRWFYLLLLLWLGASLLGGVLSLDWEAPQGARTVGATAPLALIAALPLAALASGVWVAVTSLIGRWTIPPSGGEPGRFDAQALAGALVATLVAALVVLVPLGDAFARNYDGYFVRHAHDVPSWNEMGGRQAVMGRAAAALAAQGYTVRIDPSLAGDPALTFAAGEVNYPAYDPNVPVPIGVQGTGLALIMPVDAADTLAFIRRSYPHAPVLALTPSFDQNNVQAYAVLIRQQDILNNLGVYVRFVVGGRTIERAHQQSAVAWPQGSDASTRAMLRATLLVSKDLMWQSLGLRVSGARRASLLLDGQRWPDGISGTGMLRLGAGNHDLVVEAEGKAGASLWLEWTAGSGLAMDAGFALPWRPVPPLALAAPSMPTGGLLGLYYQTTTLDGPVGIARVDQQVNTYFQIPPAPLQFPFSARWRGMLRIDTGGYYTFKLDSAGPSVLYIDGKALLTGVANTGQTASISLNPGRHTVRVDYTGAGSYLHCYLTWEPPGQSMFVPVPPTVTEPAHG